MVHLKQRARIVAIGTTALVFATLTWLAGHSMLNSPRALVRLLGTLVCLCLADVAVSLGSVAGLMAARMPAATGKSVCDGSMPRWSVVLFGPWMAVHVFWMVYQRKSHRDSVPVVSQIAPGLLLGGFPAFPGFDAARVAYDAVVDVTCELPAAASALATAGGGCGGRYLCVPTWDGMAPTARQIGEAVEWIAAQRKLGRTVLVHCFHGIGRSATVACAALIRLGHCASVDQALATLQRERRIVRLRDYHLKEVAEWQHTFMLH
jgi:hypothetical protein